MKSFCEEKKRRFLILSLIAFIFSSFFSSCSLNYSKTSLSSSQSPEFIFSNSRFSRVENGNENINIEAEKIEQYVFDNAMYASNINFNLYNDKAEKSVWGKCNFLSANLDSGLYYLFDNIQIESYEKNLSIFANSIMWNNKTEQLITGYQNESERLVTVISEETPKMQVTGSGFSASSKDFSFSFTGDVSGEIIKEN